MEIEGDCTASGPMSAGAPRDSISSTGSSTSSTSISTKTALNDCSLAWISYLNALNNLCSAGCKLGSTMTVLEQSGLFVEKSGKGYTEKNFFHNLPSSYLTHYWNDLARATAVATSTVKAHITALLQEFVVLPTVDPTSICEMEQKRIRDHNELIIMENAQAMINVQHQFCAASYDAFSSLTCCFVCQSPVGFPHEPDCIMIKQKSNTDPRSQTPSPNFGGTYKTDSSRGSCVTDQRTHLQGSLIGQQLEQTANPLDQTRGPSPLQAIFENTKGPLPNPGHLLAMKGPFGRGVRSPLNIPLFPLNGQRRWSEAAAGEVNDVNSTDVESQMRRWSMPWEAVKTDQNTVTWYQTRIMPINNVNSLHHKTPCSDRSVSNTPDINWQSCASHDGLTEAIQLLSCRPSKVQSQHLQGYTAQHSEIPNID
ncbi:uncharacterized protein LOC101460608 [Ceratitis capitata]|uniref:(Mediterranean fruit fly) hypothetical protein n=1 Tax=Ceratitis capitata TaxID=7213 RepID=A0A811UWM2_CERCA|nr:uncharacterized protein LOC101460608 [Ceratitis capitata]CAD7003330.1 unnamed protein product [Ceratitis capitata]